MATRKKAIEELSEELRELRDELSVQMHLAAADARDEWESLERKWQHFRGRAKSVGRAAGSAAEDVGDALELLGQELRRGYRKIKAAL
jgi:ElaB/YqjD/DUF883 family membrane-anchored ribosome-binding protein